jgi:uracil-DNA glycosylase family protein
MASRPPPGKRARAAPVDDRELQATRRAAADCKACPLWKPATQTVFGEGPAHARIMLVGEQPGDQEDIAGRPFVGPAGKLLDRALEEAGIDRRLVYVTNAVKHFKFELRGKRRLHKKPADAEIAACLQWLQRELDLVAPELVIALGASASRALFGRVTPIEKNRGKVIDYAPHGRIMITVHPSFLLRVPPADRAREYAQFVDDLRVAARALKFAAD